MKPTALRSVAVIGVGMSVFGKQSEKTMVDLGEEACRAAIKDANINPKKIELVYCSSLLSDVGTRKQSCLGQMIASRVGVANREITNVENACAGGSTAIRRTFLDIAVGMYDIGLALGVDSMTRGLQKGTLMASQDIDGDLGMSAPAYAALIMRRHMAEYGSTVEQFAQVAVKNSHNGSLNPYSQFQKKFTMEDVLTSRMVCDPLTLYMICPYTDGAAAVVMCAADKAGQYTSIPVWMAGSSLVSGDYTLFQKDISISAMGERAAAEAYEMAGLGPEDVDLVELHDAFAANEITNSEDLGLCPRGEGGRLVEEGVTALGGKTPVNPSGGLLSQGHPLSASGVRQVCEITWHLRGEAGKRQVKGAKVGLAHMEGGVVAGIQGGACGINILKL
ncbi:MAG: thiolase family protein [Candidatus Thorarchaeota archaeon]